MMRHYGGVVTVRYFAAARAAAGVPEETSAAPTLGALRTALPSPGGRSWPAC